jgi:hypothetical protein
MKRYIVYFNDDIRVDIEANRIVVVDTHQTSQHTYSAELVNIEPIPEEKLIGNKSLRCKHKPFWDSKPGENNQCALCSSTIQQVWTAIPGPHYPETYTRKQE